MQITKEKSMFKGTKIIASLSVIIILGILFIGFSALKSDQKGSKTASEIATSANDHRLSVADLIKGSLETGNRLPMFKIEALYFTVLDETGVDFLGSDEIFAFWDAGVSVNTWEFEDVDTLDIKSFHPVQNCIYPINSGENHINGDEKFENGKYHGWICKEEGGLGPINLKVEFYENDSQASSLYFCFNTFGIDTPLSSCYDDFIGRYERKWSVEELKAIVPVIGDIRQFKVPLCTGIANHICSSFFGGEYTFTFKITRMDDLIVPRELLNPNS